MAADGLIDASWMTEAYRVSSLHTRPRRWFNEGDPSMRTSSVRWVRVNRQGQGHGVTFTTWSGELGVWWSGSGR